MLAANHVPIDLPHPQAHAKRGQRHVRIEPLNAPRNAPVVLAKAVEHFYDRQIALDQQIVLQRREPAI